MEKVSKQDLWTMMRTPTNMDHHCFNCKYWKRMTKNQLNSECGECETDTDKFNGWVWDGKSK